VISTQSPSFEAAGQVPLKLYTATDVHPRLDDSDTLQEKQHTQVFVDVSCPSHD